MKRLARLLLAGPILAGTLMLGAAPDRADAATVGASLVIPKANAVVEADIVRLGDLFEGLDPALAERPVATAPAPGRRAAFDAPALARLAAAHGIAWRPSGGADRVELVRASHEIGPAEIADALKLAAMRAGAPDGLEVTLDNRSLAVHLPVGVERSFALEDVRWDAARNRLQADLVAPAPGGGPTVIRQTIGARAVDVVQVPVLTRRIAPGEIISDADIAFVAMARDRLGANAITDIGGLVGNTPRRGVAVNQPVRTHDVRTPVVVRKGALVVIALKTPTMALTAQGRALEDGGLGETIRVSNTASARIVEATVVGSGMVTVEPTGMPLASPVTTKPAKALRTAAR